ncbi:hypothetical protein EP227_06855, partial [bacterium]
GSGALILMYRVAGLIFGKNIGLLSAFILAIAPLHIYYSQEVRSYSLMVLLSLFSMYFFIRLMEERTSNHSRGYAIFSALLLYTHHYGLFIIVAQNIYLLTVPFLSKGANTLNPGKWLRLQITLFLIYVPWIVPWGGILIYRAIQHQTRTGWIPLPPFYSVIETFSVYCGSLSFLWFFLILAFLSLITHKGTDDDLDRENASSRPESITRDLRFPHTSRVYFLILWLLVPVFLPFIISHLFMPIYNTRYTIAASLAFYMLIAKGIDNVHKKYIQSVLILIITVISLGNTFEYYTKTDKQQWREVIHNIDQTAEEGELILFIPSYSKKFIFDYFSRRPYLQALPFPSHEKFTNESVEKLRTVTEGFNRVWFIVSHGADTEKLIEKSFNSLQYYVSYYKKYDGQGSLQDWAIIEIYLFVKDKKA